MLACILGVVILILIPHISEMGNTNVGSINVCIYGSVSQLAKIYVSSWGYEQNVAFEI